MTHQHRKPLQLQKLQRHLLHPKPQSLLLVDRVPETTRFRRPKVWEHVQLAHLARETTPLLQRKEWEPVRHLPAPEAFLAPWHHAQAEHRVPAEPEDKVAQVAVKVVPAVEDSNVLQEEAKEADSVPVVPVQAEPLEQVGPHHVQDLVLTVRLRVVAAVVPAVELLVLLVREAQRVNPVSQRQLREQNLNYVKHPS
jgi:hypothetical protein